MGTENQTINENQHTYDNGFHPKKVVLKPNYKFYKRNPFFLLWRNLVVLATAIGLFFAKYFNMGFKVTGRKNIRHIKGKVIVSNHIHQLDALLTVTNLYPRMVYATMLQSNLGFGFVSAYFRHGGAVPIPEDLKLFKKFNTETKNILEKKKGAILVYPEAALMPYCGHVRNFMSGAFHFAVNANAPIVPAVYTFHKPKGIYKILRTKGKPCLHLNFLEPYNIKDMGNKKLTLETAANELHQIMSDYFNAHSDKEYLTEPAK